jgi:hypothetical protein
VSEANEHQLRAWRLEAAEAAGLPPAMASRLNGETREAVFTDARVLADQARPVDPPTGEAQALARMALRNARAVQDLGPGVRGGQLSPAPIEVTERKRPEGLVRDDGE